MQEESKDADCEECTCGHSLDARKSQSLAGSRSHLSSPTGATKAAMDSSFVHLPIHLYQHVDEATRKPSFASSYDGASKFLETYQHLEEMIRVSQSGGDGAKLCAECITRYAGFAMVVCSIILQSYEQL